LELEGPPFEVSVDDVRRRVLRSFKDWHGWETRGDFGDLRAKVETARSIRDIIRLIESPDAAAE
jgi:hypothetical protein